MASARAQSATPVSSRKQRSTSAKKQAMVHNYRQRVTDFVKKVRES